MNRTRIGSAIMGAALLLSTSTVSFADPPPGVGPATFAEGFFCGMSVIVEPLEAQYGIINGHTVIQTSEIVSSRLVSANSNTGTQSVDCSAKIEFGEVLTGFDVFTWDEIMGIAVPTDIGCDAFADAFPGICKGGKTIILNYENTGFACELGSEGTLHWRQVTTPNGTSKLNCHSKE